MMIRNFYSMFITRKQKISAALAKALHYRFDSKGTTIQCKKKIWRTTHIAHRVGILTYFLIIKNGDDSNLKKSPQAEKITFFKIFFAVAHLPIETKLFCYYQNFISSAVQRNQGGTKQRYDKQQTNNKQRTPRTIIIARQDSFRILGLIR